MDYRVLRCSLLDGVDACKPQRRITVYSWITNCNPSVDALGAVCVYIYIYIYASLGLAFQCLIPSCGTIFSYFAKIKIIAEPPPKE